VLYYRAWRQENVGWGEEASAALYEQTIHKKVGVA